MDFPGVAFFPGKIDNGVVEREIFGLIFADGRVAKLERDLSKVPGGTDTFDNIAAGITAGDVLNVGAGKVVLVFFGVNLGIIIGKIYLLMNRS